MHTPRPEQKASRTYEEKVREDWWFKLLFFGCLWNRMLIEELVHQKRRTKETSRKYVETIRESFVDQHVCLLGCFWNSMFRERIHRVRNKTPIANMKNKFEKVWLFGWFVCSIACLLAIALHTPKPKQKTIANMKKNIEKVWPSNLLVCSVACERRANHC